MNRKIRVGRYTAAALLIVVGVLLIMDKQSGTDYLYGMVDWWPLLLVAKTRVFVEYVVEHFRESGLGQRFSAI